MADNLKEIFEEAGEFAEANNNKLTLANAVVLIAEAYELGRTKNAEVLRTLLTAKGSSKSRDETASLIDRIRNINNMQWVPRIDIDSDMPKSIVNEIVEYFSRFPFVVDDISSGWQYMRAIGHPEVEDSVSFSPLTLNDSDWCIAAPYDTMTDNITIRMYSGKEEARKRQLEDPIVFKANEIGAIIATMWDTEATDSIFDKYR